MRGCDFSGPTHRWQHDSLILLLRNALKDDSNYELHLKKGQKVIRDPNLILESSVHYTQLSPSMTRKSGNVMRSTRRKAFGRFFASGSRRRCLRLVLRSVYLWERKCVKSRALLRRSAYLPPPSERHAPLHYPKITPPQYLMSLPVSLFVLVQRPYVRIPRFTEIQENTWARFCESSTYQAANHVT